MAKSWTLTLKLPKSTFPPRPLPEFRALYLKRCTDELYQWQQTHRPAQDPFVVHDGPPYANGKLHVGHALNKILKDMSLRVQLQQGRRVQYVPGWDCHGLPIELKALGELAETKAKDGETETLPPPQIRTVARQLAARTVLEQMAEFRSFGVMADWDRRWTTMDAAYEWRQLRLFQQLVQRGLIYRKYRPVYWSPSSRTALAEAELEYNDRHVSTAAFVKMRLDRLDSLAGRPALAPLFASSSPPSVSLVIWTTTPWTLPANEAIAVHRDMLYAVVRHGQADKDYLVVAEACLANWEAVCGPATVVARGLLGADLLGLRYRHPLRADVTAPVIHADFVTDLSGSGLVHMAPGHGFEDYDVAAGQGLPAPAPVDDEGRFTASVGRPELVGLPVQGAGNAAVLALLGPTGSGTGAGTLLGQHRFTHKYPYDWRTKQPVIVRATAQWFADVGVIKQAAVASLAAVQFVPAAGRSRLESFVRGRSEWCISRQRAWGVPIPALHGDDGSVELTGATLEHVLGVLQARGTDAWWSDAADDAAWIPEALQRAHPTVRYRRGTDTMDVWFDSGSSWTMLAEGQQADVYLEGSDQHRGWFQSSLLTRVAAMAGTRAGLEIEGAADATAALAPFKTLVTHGFLLDGEGKKMSKSLGNIVTGAAVMEGELLQRPAAKTGGKGRRTGKADKAGSALGPDALRLWVAGSDYTGDVVISPAVLQATHAALLRYRGMIRMLLGSLPAGAKPADAPLTALDHMAVLQLQDAMAAAGAAYRAFEFYKALAVLNHWLANDLSAFYLEAAKDRLYCADGGGVLEPLLVGLLRMLAPVAPLLVEEAWDHAPAWLRETEHPLRQRYEAPLIDLARLPGDSARLRRAMPVIMAAHAAVKAASERARADKVLGSSLQCSVVLELPSAVGSNETATAAAVAALAEHADELASMFVVSSVELAGTAPDAASAAWQYAAPFAVGRQTATAWVRPPLQAKCPRCWRYVAEHEDELCGRCADVVGRGE